MANIEKRHLINSESLSGEYYFASILQEAMTCGLLDESEMENIQFQSIKLLEEKSRRYNFGESCSVKVETAESIMKSNLYTIGLYLKALPDPESAAKALKTTKISELYEKGRELVENKLQEAKHIYSLVQQNRIATSNHSYNSTLSEDGIGIFFKSYDWDFEAHETPASIDYQLCNQVTDLAGVEFIQKYLETLYLENEFCQNFSTEDIYHLLYGYDDRYEDLLINIFERLLTSTLGCSLLNREVRGLHVSVEDTNWLSMELQKYDEYSLALLLREATKSIFRELNIASISLQKYIEESLPNIAAAIDRALETNTLDKVFITPLDPDLKPVIHFASGDKMDDEEYRKLIDELLSCRYSNDKLALINEKVKSFDDLEDVLLDAQLAAEEIFSLFGTLGDVEIAELIRRHRFESEVYAVDLSESEQVLRSCLKAYVKGLQAKRRERIIEVANQLVG